MSREAITFLLILLPRLVFGQEHSATAPDHSLTMNHSTTNAHEMMSGFYGSYPMTREASGTSWQPEATPPDDIHFSQSDWTFMLHGFAFGTYDHQGGPRGGEKFISQNMVALMAQHPIGEGRFGLRTMLSLEPATIGKDGYPELLQTGETADGRSPLIDRQHPHDLFMELAVTYNHPLPNKSSVFAYFGFSGEPALGPPTYMHRFSGMDNPEAPLTHHWQDSTHISYGVATVGYTWKEWKIDGSIFNGREPDQRRWDFDTPRFDSYAGRLSYNPTASLSFQVSYGRLNHPEQLGPVTNTKRTTASVIYHKTWGQNNWQTALIWGRNRNHPGNILDGFLLESAFVVRERHTFIGRAERVDKDELFPGSSPFAGKIFTVNKLSLGYIYDFPKLAQAKIGIGGLASVQLLPASLKAAYGETPLSFLLFVRAKL